MKFYAYFLPILFCLFIKSGQIDVSKPVSKESESFIRSVLKKREFKDADTITIRLMEKDTGSSAHVLRLSSGIRIEISSWIDEIIKTALKGEIINYCYMFDESPYVVELRVSSKEALNCVEAIIEHETGHLVHEHLYALSKWPLFFATFVCSVVSVVSSFIFYKRFHEWKEGKVVGKIFNYSGPYYSYDDRYRTFIEILISLSCSISCLVNSLKCIDLIYKGNYKNALDREREADAFVSENEDILKALARYFIFHSLLQKYILSYCSQEIQKMALQYSMKPHEFYEKHTNWCTYNVFNKDKTHPTYDERIATLKNRIVQLSVVDSENFTLSDIEQCKMIVYEKDTGTIVQMI